MYEYNREAMQRQMQTKTAINEHEMAQNPHIQEVRTKLQDAQSLLEREQQKLDMTPRMRNNKHNQDYGKQINVVMAAKENVTRVEEEVRKGENSYYRGTYLAKLDAKRQAEKDAREKPILEQAEKAKAEFKATARTRWLAEGGEELRFEMQFDDMYDAHIRQKMQGPDAREQTKQKLAKSGRYDI
jgi:hypothetical protein